MISFFELKKVKIVCIGIVCLFALFAVYSFVTTPFTGDIKVFMAAANQVHFQKEDGLVAVFEAWEIKGIVNRLLMYTIYRLSNSVAGFSNMIQFEVASKFFYAFFVIIVLAFSAYLMAEKWEKRLWLFLVFQLSFFCTFTAVQLQAEMTCVALCIFIMACMVHNRMWSFIVAGIAGAILFYFKSIFILMFLSTLFGVAAYEGGQT